MIIFLPDERSTLGPDRSDEVRATEDPALEGRDHRPETEQKKTPVFKIRGQQMKQIKQSKCAKKTKHENYFPKHLIGNKK
jgi:hypothetical protein